MFFCEIVRIAEAEPPYSFQTRKLKGKKGGVLKRVKDLFLGFRQRKIREEVGVDQSAIPGKFKIAKKVWLQDPEISP
jgi:hypothetical protein